MWPFSLRRLIYPKIFYNWVPIHMLHETEKAILIDNGTRAWVPKSRIRDIRLKGNVFEVYMREGTVG